MRINLFGGPGSGKSTLAARIFSDLKVLGHEVGLVQEWVKDWAYLNRPIKSFDQIHVLGQQIHKEDMLLYSGVEHIVTDSPVMLSAFYGQKYGFPAWEAVLDICFAWDQRQPCINLFVERSSGYRPAGRYQTAEESEQIDTEMYAFLRYTVGCQPVIVRKDEPEQALAIIKESLCSGGTDSN